MTEAHNTFIVCDLLSLYDSNMNFIQYTYKDILTKYPVIINPQIQSDVEEIIREHTKENGICNTICFSGYCICEDNTILALSLDSVYMLNTKATTFYIDIEGDVIVFKDIDTDNYVRIANAPKQRYEELLQDIVNDSVNNNFDFSKNGNKTITVIGSDINYRDNNIIYDYDSLLALNITENVVSQVYKLVQNQIS